MGDRRGVGRGRQNRELGWVKASVAEREGGGRGGDMNEGLRERGRERQTVREREGSRCEGCSGGGGVRCVEGVAG